MTNGTQKLGPKAVYKAPILVHYGSVRNLTGGSLGEQNDGMGTMMTAAGMGM